MKEKTIVIMIIITSTPANKKTENSIFREKREMQRVRVYVEEDEFFLAKLWLLLGIHTLITLLLTPTYSHNCCTTASSWSCILHPSFSAKLYIFSFCSFVNLGLNLFFTSWGGLAPPISCSSDSEGSEPNL